VTDQISCQVFLKDIFSMPKKITEAQKQEAIKLLSAGNSLRYVEKKTGISKATLNSKKNGIWTEADKTKSETSANFKENNTERIKDLASGMLDVVIKCQQHLSVANFKDQSPASIATVAGIMTDKMQLLTGGATENVQILAGDKSALIKKMTEESKQTKSASVNAEAPKAEAHKVCE
jgi:hypothetical protein